MPLRAGRVDPTGADLPPPPPGWSRENGCYLPIGTVSGCAARRVRLCARCKANGCGRRVELDWAELTRMGYADVLAHDVQKMFECRRPGPCGLRWEPEQYPAGVPLAALVDQRRGAAPAAVVVACEACRRQTVYTPLELAAVLARRAAGGLHTGLIELQASIRGPCRCGARRWTVAVRRG